MLRSQHPQAGLPFRTTLAGATLQRQHESNGFIQTTFEHTTKPLAFFGVVEFAVLGIDVDRELTFFQHISQRICVGADHVIGIDRKRSCEFLRKSLCVGCSETIVTVGIGGPALVMPHRHSVDAPITTERPTRQRFAGVQLSLSKVEESSWRETPSQAFE